MEQDTTVIAEQIQAIPASLPLYTDNLIVVGLIICGFILAAVISDRKFFLPHLLKGFFLPRESANESVRTSNVINMRLGMILVNLVSGGLLMAIYLSGVSSVEERLGLLWLLSIVATALTYLLRLSLMALTDRIFFDKSVQVAWERSYINWIILSGIPLYLSAIIAVFANLTPSAILLCLGGCIILLEICLLYKAFHIFSGKKYGFLQLFAYLCALELIPLLIAGKALVLFV